MPLLDINSQDLPKISITLSMWKKAKDFADRQADYQKAQQVYFNTLAVLSADQYLQLRGIKTDLSNSNSHSLAMQTMLDNAELNLPGYGVIDCRSLSKYDQCLIIPEDANLCIASLAIFISRDFSCATFLGFAPQATKGRISLNTLKPIEGLVRFLVDYQKSQKIAAIASQRHGKSYVASWLTGTSSGGWLDLTEKVIQKLRLNMLTVSERSLVFRNSVKSNSAMIVSTESRQQLLQGVSKVKLWEFKQQDQQQKFAIVICVLPASEEEVDISIQIFPTENNTYLPVGITIQILDDHNKIILQVETTSENDKIEFCLSGQPLEVFSIQGICDHQVQTERFVI